MRARKCRLGGRRIYRELIIRRIDHSEHIAGLHEISLTGTNANHFAGHLKGDFFGPGRRFDGSADINFSGYGHVARLCKTDRNRLRFRLFRLCVARPATRE